ncbi:ribulose-phosphate 3-epimerase [Sporanaerobacter sp. PP17-6a]|jgi:ribulose-phosphate 3-epimerase|uniref:ribulose-phosphate 3-epimerase n=1 Tax=Sporanaerobacter sp. PP17-6a TaxID=1891289 RepID=UPI0008DA28CB|nr:ribulose-phosphate 3-epimerase [Sporanaerobacter sp. PP17-6a]
MTSKISPSLMCIDFTNIEEDIKLLKASNVDYLHFDIMDGNFVPNYTFGPDFMNSIRKITDLPFDIHLMVENPERKLDFFNIREGDIVSIHYESTTHVQRVLEKIKDLGVTPSIALNPSTPICCIEDILDDIGVVLIMTVNPGFAGQKMIPAMLNKIGRLRHYLDIKGYKSIEIEVDGNVSFENSRRMKKAGANIFVAGTSSIFSNRKNIRNGVYRLKAQIMD